MINVVTSQVYSSVIVKTIDDTDHIIIRKEEVTGKDFDLKKYVKENVATWDTIEKFVIDLSAVNNLDEEILEAVENILMLQEDMELIILATNRQPGDSLLSKLIDLSIWNIVCTTDFVQIKEELRYCLEHGKKFRDVQPFREAKKESEKVLLRTEHHKVVDKVLLAVAGAQSRIGTTHISILLANYLRKKGFGVAYCEFNGHEDIKELADAYECKMIDGCFSLNGVEYYESCDATRLAQVVGKGYNFVIADMGTYEEADLISFHKAHKQIIVCGIKPWEGRNLYPIYEVDEDTLKAYQFLFNFVNEKDRKNVVASMTGLKVSFQKYIDDLESSDFEAEEIIKEYMPEEIGDPKKTLFGWRKK